MAQPTTQAPHPLWEVGAGMGTGLLPDYPGSDQEHYHFAAFPVLFYHGRVLRADREDGARARVVNKPVLGVDVSGSGSFPIESKQNRARSGMKSLGWMGELGPRAFVRLYDSPVQQWRVFSLLRGAISAKDNDIKARGLVFGSGVSYERKRLFVNDLSFYSKLTAQWATQEFSDYYYSVPDADATPTRAAYNAKAGYYGTWLSGGLSYEFSDFIVSGGVSMISTKGSANERGPLFRDDLNWSFFIGLAWFFYHSDAPGYF